MTNCIHHGRLRGTKGDIAIHQCDAPRDKPVNCVPKLVDLPQMIGTTAVSCEGCPLFPAFGAVNETLAPVPSMPLVSCILPTYNMPERKQALEEAIESFLRQDYPSKELIVIIDSPGQILEFKHPLVKVINSSERFATLGEKLNAAVRSASGEFLCRFDDDDISLPNRLSSQVARLQEGFDYVTPASLFAMDRNTIEWQMQRGYGHSEGMFRMSAYVELGGYPNTSGDEDAAFHQILQGRVKHTTTPEVSYVYRWGDGLNHISGHGARMQQVYNVNATVGQAGTYSLCPRWNRDYVSLTRAVTSSGGKISLPPVSPVKLCVVGFPSRYGGADTELDHQITCWRAMGVEVHLIPTGPLDDNQRSLGVAERGCTIHHPRDWAASRGMHVISYCNGEFLKALPEIRKYARTTTFVNCMTWLFNEEKKAHANRLIDWSLYQTDHARAKVEAQLKAINPQFRWAKVRPFFDASAFPFVENRSDAEFVFCRVSRDDPAKFATDTFRQMDMLQSPAPKRGVVLGITPKIYEKIGPAAAYVECLPPGGRPARDVYAESHVLLQACDTYENLPRVAMEAMASGCVPVVDNRGGFTEIIENGKSGVLCGSTFDFVYAASQLAQNPEHRRQMAQYGRQRIVELFGLEAAAREWAKFFEKLEATAPPVKPMTLTERAKSLVSVTARTALARVQGQPGLLEESAIQARLDTCNTCPRLGNDGKCGICGCDCNGRQEWFNKLAHPTAVCPDNPSRW